jgi:hypothetical protein
MPILHTLTVVLYVASGLIVAAAAWHWRKLTRIHRVVSARAFRQTARLTAIGLAMFGGSLLCDVLVGVLPSRCATLGSCDAGTAPNASVTVHLDEATPAIDAALITESDRLTRDCNNRLASACGPSGRIAVELESRGYCRPDASGRWEKSRDCARIIGKPDLALGLPIAGSVDTSPQPSPRNWQRRKRTAW